MLHAVHLVADAMMNLFRLPVLLNRLLLHLQLTPVLLLLLILLLLLLPSAPNAKPELPFGTRTNRFPTRI